MKTHKAYADGRAGPSLRRVSRLVALYDVCLQNARALQAEAELLLSNGFTARAFALAFTGWEETGKAQIVADFANGMASENEFDAAFRNHNLKVAYNRRQFILDPKDPARSAIEYDETGARQLFEGRQRALYVGKTADDAPIVPDQEISRVTAERAIAALKKELDDIRVFDAMNERIGSASFLK